MTNSTVVLGMTASTEAKAQITLMVVMMVIYSLEGTVIIQTRSLVAQDGILSMGATEMAASEEGMETTEFMPAMAMIRFMEMHTTII